MSTNRELTQRIEFRDARDAYRKLQEETRRAILERKAQLLTTVAATNKQLARAREDVETLPIMLTALEAELRALETLGLDSMIGLVALAVTEEQAKAAR